MRRFWRRVRILAEFCSDLWAVLTGDDDALYVEADSLGVHPDVLRRRKRPCCNHTEEGA